LHNTFYTIIIQHIYIHGWDLYSGSHSYRSHLDLQVFVAFSKTHAPQPRSPSSFAPACRKHRPRRPSVSGAWPAHAREPFALWRASQPRSTFSGSVWWRMGSTMVDLQLGGASDSVCPPPAAVSNRFRPCLFCRQPFFFLLLCCVFLLFLLYSMLVYCSNFIGILVG
jgi:hypothetical protein